MSREPNTTLLPERFCGNDGVETGIRVAEGYDLCLDYFRDYRAAKAKVSPRIVCAPAAPAPAQVDLFRRTA